MRKSICEHSNRFKLGEMMCLETSEKSEKSRKSGRSSINAIPPPDPAIIFSPKPVVKAQEATVTNESENLCDSLCNSFKFVVNYGVFEPNFEWMPCEVSLRIFKLVAFIIELWNV
jgi:hypothetical protein